MPNSDIVINSEEIQEIIGQIPPWIIRWGITVLISVFFIAVFCSYYIKFPDILSAKVIISSQYQPFRASWYRNGPQFHKIFVAEGDTVKDGDTLLTEESMVDGSITPVITPVGGKVLFLKGTEDNPRKSTIIVYPNISNYNTELYIPSKGVGKVKPHQNVLIKLDAFPEEDFGVLEGKIVSIVPISIDGKYRAKVMLIDGLVTTENKVIPPQHFVEGRAEILLEERNLFHRIFGSLIPF